MVTAELISWLVSDGQGTAGTTLFREFMPADPDALVCLYAYGGSANEPEMGGRTVRMEFPHVAAHSRGVKDEADAPCLKLVQIVTSFAKIGDQDISGVRYGAVMAIAPPSFLRKDDNGRFIYVCNFRITKGYSSS